MKNFIPKFIPGLLLALFTFSAAAQNYTAPTPATGDNSNRISTTAFVQNTFAAGGNLPLLNGKIYVGNASNIATGVTPSGDCSLTNLGVISCNNIPLSSANIFVGSASNISTARALSGDCTISNLGLLTCTKTNGTNFGALATLGAGTGLSSGGGNLNISNTITAGSVGSSSLIPVLTYNAQGQLTAVTTATNSGSNITPQNYNASGSGASTTGTISASSSSLSLASAQDFANNQGIRINHAGAAFAISQPSSLTVTPTGATGATARAYTVASLDAAGGVGRSIANTTIANSNATLTTTNYNHLAWNAPGGTAPSFYAVYGNTSGSMALIGIVGAGTTTFDDVGSGAITAADFVPAAPQTSAALNDWLVTTIASGGGTTTLTLAASATVTATSQTVIHDDTAALLAAIAAAQITGAPVYLPQGTYCITSNLAITDRIKFYGSGYQSDAGAVYNSTNISQSTGFKASVIVPTANISAISATTNHAVDLESFQIIYPIGPTAFPGTFGITIQAAAGATSSNVNSIVRNVLTLGAYNGMSMTNALDFVIDNVNLLQGWASGLNVGGSNFPSYGDSVVTNSTFWGNGVTTYSCHICISAGGGLRMINNKMNFGSGTATSGILVAPSLAVVQTTEPLVISGNSIEGSAVGVNFVNGNVANAIISQVVISGNQMWNGSQTILVNTNGVTQWIGAMAITGNTLMVNGNSGSGKTALILDNVGIGSIAGNTFSCSVGCTSSTAILLKANTNYISVGTNGYYSGFDTQVSNLGTNNTTGAVAGGSNTQVQFNSSNALAGSATLTWVSPELDIGAAGATGILGLAGTTSGKVSQKSQAVAGTPTVTWGTSSGTPAVTASSPLAITAATGNVTCATCVTSSGGGAISGTAPISVSAAGAVSITGAAGQILAGASPAFTATPTFGVSGTSIGTLSLAGNTSGAVTLTPQATAGSPTVTFGTGSGTPAVTATSPLAISSTTGNATCTTCATTTNGGALSGTSPVAISAAGAISLSGGAGQVPNGATGAFTATPTLGASGTLGSITMGNATSGTINVQPVTGALGTPTLSLPAATDTLVGKATTDTLTNKTLTSALVTTKLSPTSDDGAPLGDGTHEFSDLFLAAGGVINWANGGITITEASDALNFAGVTANYNFDNPLSISIGSGATSLLGTSTGANNFIQLAASGGNTFTFGLLGSIAILQAPIASKTQIQCSGGALCPLESSTLGLGVTATTALTVVGTSAQTILQARNSTAGTAGQGLTLDAGGSIAGTSNLAGGNLTLQSGISTGTGSSSLIFKTADVGASASTDNTRTTKATLDNKGHLGFANTTAPTVGSCGGGSPAVASGSTDTAGELTEGTTATGCTLTFANSGYTTAPKCVVSAQTQFVAFAYTISTTAITITNTSASGAKVNWICFSN